MSTDISAVLQKMALESESQLKKSLPIFFKSSDNYDDTLKKVISLLENDTTSSLLFRQAVGWDGPDDLMIEIVPSFWEFMSLQPWRQVMLCHLLHLIGENAPVKNLLEVGSGTGLLASAVNELKYVKNYSGVDINAKWVEFNNSKCLPMTEFIHSDFCQWSPQKTYEIAVSYMTYHHIADKERGITKLSECLKPGAKIMILDKFLDIPKNSKSVTGELWQYHDFIYENEIKPHNNSIKEWMISFSEFISLLRCKGFRIEKVDFFNIKFACIVAIHE